MMHDAWWRLCDRGFLPPVGTGHEIATLRLPKGVLQKLSGDIDALASASAGSSRA
jgi:hypothetical protein